jgi:hypothetical protein
MPPAVVSVTPASGSAGNTPQEEVMFVFNKAMDPASVSAFIDVSGYVSVTPRWTEGDTVLTLVPNDPVELLVIDSVEDETRQEFTVSLTAGALDATGQALTEDAGTTFTMARELPVRTALKSELTGCISSTGQHSELWMLGDDGSDNAWVTLLTFDLSGIPTQASGLASASLSLESKVLIGDPFGELGTWTLDRMSVDGLSGAVTGSALATQAGPTQEGSEVVEAASLFQDDVGESDGRGQVRLSFSEVTDDGEDRDLVQLEDAALKLVVYVP